MISKVRELFVTLVAWYMRRMYVNIWLGVALGILY